MASAIATATEVIEAGTDLTPETVTLKNGKTVSVSILRVVLTELKRVQKNNPEAFNYLVTDCLERYRMTANDQGMIWLPRSGRFIEDIKRDIIVLATCQYDDTSKRYYLVVEISSPGK